MVEGYNGVPLPNGYKTPDYLSGYQQGKSERADIGFTKPPHTDDNYLHFYIGYHDVAVAADNDYTKGNLGYYGCPAGHTQEYCQGYEARYNDEGWALRDA